ncbi:YhdP family protein [Thalassomonas sp. M1454]|uniref:YhdP family protein n=1 Tax=Thalassomonas sp. M1454 TaxID=2594477 RepID=UPI0011816FE6|nr:YhdP family protein [Thalassomonas sp. M1454]TRX52793.1 TIGR02099 family protein [Thalassomonas sp. M1454]
MKTFWGHANTWLSRLYKTLAILLVVFAVLLSAARILLPYADNYKEDVEEYINSAYEGDIEIGELSAGWRNFGPTLVVRDVVLSNSSSLNISVEEVNLGLDFWGSVQAQKVKAKNLTLVGALINLDQSQLTAGSQTQSTQTAEDLDIISDLLLQQIKRFSVLDSKIIIKNSLKKRTFNISKLAWHNDGTSHKGIGKIEIDGLSQDTAKLVVELNGTVLSDLNGQIYIEGNNIDLTGWFIKLLGDKHDQIGSNINFQSWVQINQGSLTNIELALGETSFSWLSFEQQHKLTIPKAHVSLYRDGLTSNFFAQSSNIEVDFNGTPWTEFYIQTQYQRDSIESYISAVSLDNLWQLYPILEENFPTLAEFSKLHLSGDLENIHLKTTLDGIQAKVDLNSLAWQYANNIPGISGVSGEVLYAENKLALNINAKNSALDFNQHFSRPIPFNDLNAEVNAYWNDSTWTLAVKDIGLSSDELNLQGSVQYFQPENGSGELGIFAYLDRAQADQAQYYLPLSIMSDSLVDYLNAAIKSGQGKQVAVLFNGPVSNFPFIDNSGIFVVDADLEQAEYEFVEGWPAITGGDVNLNFTNDSMLITANDGDLNGVNTKDVVVGIESLSGESILTVRAPVTAQVSDIQNLMLASPMADSVGKVLEFIGPQGLVNGSFALDVPLADTDNTVAKGVIDLNDNQVFLSAPEMEFKQISGQLTFVNEKITTKDFNVIWRGLPIAMNVNGYHQNDAYKLSIDLDGQWQPNHYLGQIPDPLKSYVDGKLDWQGKLNINVPDDGPFSYKVDLNSDLVNAQLLLPQPYDKTIGTMVKLSANVSGDEEHSMIEAKLGNNLHFYGSLNHQQTAFTRSHLVLGDEAMLLPISGFHITTNLAQINYQQWHELVFNIIDSIPESDPSLADAASKPLIGIPERIRGSLFGADFYGQQITDISFNLLNRTNSWVLQLNTDQIRSRFKFYHDFKTKGLEVDADFIHLIEQVKNDTNDENSTDTADTAEPVGSTLLPDDIPPIKFYCKSCKYSMLDFGEVNFTLARNAINSVELTEFIAKRKGNEVNFTGNWLKDPTQNTTSIQGIFKTNDLEKEIEAFDLESGIKDSGLTSNFDLNWQGDPQQFNFASLNGQLNVKLDDGYLADVDDKGARLLSIFSFQSLVRKLSLDFRDIFSNGMFYEDMKGNFTVVDGVIYTDDVEVDATAGKLKVQGNTNLVNNQLDYKMSFAPKVTSSLPVIVSWMVNPVVGIAALVADKVIEKAEVISVINFELTGTVDEPNFKEVDRKSRDINVGKSKPDAVPEPNQSGGQ